MNPIQPERVERGSRPPAEPGPGIVEIVRSRGQTQARQVERDPTQPTMRQLGQYRAIDERRCRYAVQAHDRLRVRRPLIEDETPYAVRRELPPSGPVSGQNLVNCHDITPPPVRPELRRRPG